MSDHQVEMMWPGAGEIKEIWIADDTIVQIGLNEVTRIEKTYKPGLHSDLPYVRVWSGDVVLSEHCQHQLTGVFFVLMEDA